MRRQHQIYWGKHLQEVFAEGHELGLEFVLQGTGWRVTPALQPFGAYSHFVGIMSQGAESSRPCFALASAAVAGIYC